MTGYNKPSEQVFDRSVTLARALLQSHADPDVYATVRVADDAFLFAGALATTLTRSGGTSRASSRETPR